MGSPFSFWSAGTDNGVPPPGPPRGRLRTFLLFLAAMVVVVVLVAVFIPR